MAVLLLGSNATVLISTYNIGSEVGNLGLWMGIRSCGMLLLAAVTWVGISLLERWQEEGKQLPLLLLWAADIVSCLMAMFLSRGNTASVFGILIGLPMAILAILTMCTGFQADGARKIVSVVLCALICLTLVVKHETGIPALLYAAFFVWYTLFYPRRNRHKKWIALLLAAVPAGGIGILWLANSLFEKSGISFLADLAGKFSIRAGMTYQIESGLKSLTKAGLFGSYRASHLPEWQTDMILVSDTHYLGWGFLFLMLLVTQEITEGLAGMDLLQTALQYHLGGFGVVFIAATLALFSFSTFLGVLYYARGNVAYLCGDNWWSQTVYKLIALAMLVIGGMQAYTVVWDLGDVGIGLMTIFNMIALVPMAKEALAALNDYEKRKKLQ